AWRDEGRDPAPGGASRGGSSAEPARPAAAPGVYTTMPVAGREHRNLRDKHALGREALAALFFLALSVAATRPLAAVGRTHVLGHLDVLVDLWTVHWLTTHFFDPGQLFQGNIFQPARHAVLHSDLSLCTVVLLLPLRPFVRDPVPLMNLAVLLALAFGGWAFHALAHALTGDRRAGLPCGALAVFNS